MVNVRRLTVVLVVVLTLVVAAASTALASTHGRAAAAKYPPCTKAALSAALRRGSAAITVRFVKPFGCARNWAYSAAIVGKGRVAAEITVLYHNNRGRWRISDRDGPCNRHAVPKKIYAPACETN